MRSKHFPAAPTLFVLLATLAGCSPPDDAAPTAESTLQAFIGGRLIDGSGETPMESSVIIVENGVIQAVGERGEIDVPEAARVIDLTGTTLVPGLVNAHGHVGDVVGLETGRYSRENVLDQLGVYARYGITTVVSLGDDREDGLRVRDEQEADAGLARARLHVAGPVLNPTTPEEAEQQVAKAAAMGVDWIKIRVDSNLGATPKMSPETYAAVIRTAHENDLPVAAQMIELEDAKQLVRSGVDLLAHSVRDTAVDDELIGLLRQNRVCLVPTLTRELSTFVYGERPDFFDDPFLLREADPAVIEQLQDPERQRSVRSSAAATYWRNQLPVAEDNVKRLSDAGVPLAMGTDTGPPGRFQGYFEHLEMEMMVESGLTPMQVLVAATRDAARCVGLEETVGTIEPGKRADFVVLEANPLDDIRNTREIQSVWINGNRVPDRGQAE